MLGKRWSAFAAALAFGVAGASAAAAQTVRVDAGALQGATEGAVASFKGVPYAKPPVGALRWAPPQPVSAWTGPRDAARLGAPCPQAPARGQALIMSGGDPAPSSEDCLFLNVWTPSGAVAPAARASGARKLPVMIWLHGGGMRTGSGGIGWYDGTPFARDGVVLVTVNYRLGPLGWLAHPALTRAAQAKGEAFGNYGLMDQIAALAWVKRNIAAFGGDPANVTVFGESAGGASVLMLMTSLGAKGLFAKAIVQSGGNGRANPLAEAEAAGARAFGPALTVEQLRALPLEQVNTAEGQQASGALIDGRLVTQTPRAAMLAGRAVDVPLIIGSNSGEDSLMGGPTAVADTLKMVPPERSAAVRAAYGPDAADDTKLAHALFTDLHMGAPAKAFAAAEASGAPAWLYQFDYVPEGVRAMLPKAAHGLEIFFVFQSLQRGPIPLKPTAADTAQADLIHRCWVAFAKVGRPECGIDWPAYQPSADALAYFGQTNAVKAGFRREPYRAIEGLWAGR